jgi:transposase
MIMLPSAVRIFLCTRPTDMRKSFDGLSGLVQECFGQDPLTGHLFLFLNRRGDRTKILDFDRDGLALWYKRLEAGSFEMPPTAEPDGIELQATQFAMILSGIDIKSARQRQRFQHAGSIPTKGEKSAPIGLNNMKTPL